jgi:choline dehydrogenase-like flavoprotein
MSLALHAPRRGAPPPPALAALSARGARRAARRAAAAPPPHASATTVPPPSAPHVAVIGAGWGGWGAAKALAEAGVRVTLLDAARDPTGATPFLTPTGKPFEAGTRGFWKARARACVLCVWAAAVGGRGARLRARAGVPAAARRAWHRAALSQPRNRTRARSARAARAQHAHSTRRMPTAP